MPKEFIVRARAKRGTESCIGFGPTINEASTGALVSCHRAGTEEKIKEFERLELTDMMLGLAIVAPLMPERGGWIQADHWIITIEIRERKT